ncbi:MAG: mechanosensitive ion channel domain-containing protein [Candidatus Sulfotelmatobacter sp.]
MTRLSFKLRIFAWYIFLVVVLSPGVLSADSQIPESYNLPSKQQVITFLTETIEWYRYLSVERQIAAEPFDFLFLDDNEPVGTQVVQLSFDFARTDASLAAPSKAALQNTPIPDAVTSDFQHIVQMEVKADAESEQASNELESIKTRLVRTRGAHRRKLEATLANAQSRLGVLQEHSKSLRKLAELIQANGVSKPQTADLGSLVEDLARTVPEVSNSNSSPPGTPRIISDPKPQDSGILGLASEVSTLQAKLRTLDEGRQLTDKLAHSSESLRTPLRNFVNQAIQSDDLGGGLQSSNLELLRQQTARLDALTSRITSLAPAVSALDKQRVLLAIYRSRLTNWRKAVINEYSRAWKNLILHLVLLGLVIVALIGVSVVLRRATIHYVHDANRRRMILVVQTILTWLSIVLVVAFGFASDLKSLATFLGLLTAGMAVALQNVILAVLGYFLLVGKLGISVGDRVQISGVTGDVISIGLLQFQLREIDARQQLTGHIATFSNSFVFVSPATGLFKFLPDHSITDQPGVVKPISHV